MTARRIECCAQKFQTGLRISTMVMANGNLGLTATNVTLNLLNSDETEQLHENDQKQFGYLIFKITVDFSMLEKTHREAS